MPWVSVSGVEPMRIAQHLGVDLNAGFEPSVSYLNVQYEIRTNSDGLAPGGNGTDYECEVAILSDDLTPDLLDWLDAEGAVWDLDTENLRHFRRELRRLEFVRSATPTEEGYEEWRVGLSFSTSTSTSTLTSETALIDRSKFILFFDGNLQTTVESLVSKAEGQSQF